MKIGLALSGGGSRAGVFHIGVLKCLAEHGYLEHVSFISSVSGGSILVGQIFKINNYCWPSSKIFLKHTLPQLEEHYTKFNFHSSALLKILKHPFLIFKRSQLLSKIFEEDLMIKEDLQCLPDVPRWAINANTLETGKSWRFSKQRMGDYKVGYVISPKFSIAKAMAISASFPFLIGANVIDTTQYSWSKYDNDGAFSPNDIPYKKIHLYDGGVYENIGAEALFEDWPKKLRPEIDCAIFSDASAPFPQNGRNLTGIKHLMTILSDQVRALRTRGTIAFLSTNPGTGVYAQLGNNCIGLKTELSYEPDVLSKEHIRKIKNYKTDLKNVTPEYFFLLAKHGYEVTLMQLKKYPLQGK